MEFNEKWKLTTQNNAYLWEGNQISKQNRYPCSDLISLLMYFQPFRFTCDFDLNNESVVVVNKLS